MTSHEPGTDTRERLLDAAEDLFARQGIDATSLRALTAEAGANLASVNYYFGSKEELVREVFARRLGPINQERLRLLALAEAEAGRAPPSLERVVEAFIAPPLRLRLAPQQGGHPFMCLIGRLFCEPRELRSAFLDQFEQVSRRFSAALSRALPGLSREELFWRMHFLIGSMSHVAGASDVLSYLSGGLCDPTDVEGTIRRLTAFATAGLRAELCPREGEKP